MKPFLALAAAGVMLSSTTAWSETAPGVGDSNKKLEDRLYMQASNIYDPASVLGWFGIVSDGTVTFYEKPPKTTSNFKYVFPKIDAYKMTVDKSNSGSLSIPIIGSGSLDDTHKINVQLTDISYVDLPNDQLLGRCQIWDNVKGKGVKAGDKIIYINHALLSQVVTSRIVKSENKGSLGVGNYFQIGADFFSQEGETTIVPAVSVLGLVIDITDQLIKNGCPVAKPKVHRFDTVIDLQNLGITNLKTMDITPIE